MARLTVTTMTYERPPAAAIYAPGAMPGHFNVVGNVAGHCGRVLLEMEMDLTPGSQSILSAIRDQNGILDFGVERREWRCIWCGVPNDIDHRFCTQCGGPRGWVL